MGGPASAEGFCRASAITAAEIENIVDFMFERNIPKIRMTLSGGFHGQCLQFYDFL